DCAVMLTSCAAFSVAPPPRYDSTVDVPVAVASAPAPAPPMLTAIDVATESVFEIVSSDDAVMLTPPPVDFRLTLSAKALTLLSAVFFAIETPTEAPIRPTDIDAAATSAVIFEVSVAEIVTRPAAVRSLFFPDVPTA